MGEWTNLRPPCQLESNSFRAQINEATEEIFELVELACKQITGYSVVYIDQNWNLLLKWTVI